MAWFGSIHIFYWIGCINSLLSSFIYSSVLLLGVSGTTIFSYLHLVFLRSPLCLRTIPKSLRLWNTGCRGFSFISILGMSLKSMRFQFILFRIPNSLLAVTFVNETHHGMVIYPCFWTDWTCIFSREGSCFCLSSKGCCKACECGVLNRAYWGNRKNEASRIIAYPQDYSNNRFVLLISLLVLFCFVSFFRGGGSYFLNSLCLSWFWENVSYYFWFFYTWFSFDDHFSFL